MVLGGRPQSEFNQLHTINHAKGQAAMFKRLLEVSTCPDFIEDKGHYYGHDLRLAMIAHRQPTNVVCCAADR